MNVKSLLIVGLPVFFLLPELPAAVEDFGKYPDSEALRKNWTAFDSGNPAPVAALSIRNGVPEMELVTDGGAGDKVIVRELAVPPGERLTFDPLFFIPDKTVKQKRYHV